MILGHAEKFLVCLFNMPISDAKQVLRERNTNQRGSDIYYNIPKSFIMHIGVPEGLSAVKHHCLPNGTFSLNGPLNTFWPDAK